jgi:membrane protein DedA with SNARE-associated domain
MLLSLTPLMLTLGPLALLLVMGIVFAETGLLVGFFLPGDSLLFIAGALVASGVLHLPLVLVLAGVFLAAAAGDQVGYLLGRRFGPRVFAREESRFFSPRHAARAAVFYERYGSKAVILGRFIPVVRTFTPVTAGVGRMSYGRFVLFNLVGALMWAVGIVLAGFFLGGVPIIAAHIEVITVSVVALSLIPAVIGLIRRRKAPVEAPDAQVLEPVA